MSAQFVWWHLHQQVTYLQLHVVMFFILTVLGGVSTLLKEIVQCAGKDVKIIN